jgi:hypothetical protein
MGRRTGLCRLGVQEMNDDQVLKSEFYEWPFTTVEHSGVPILSEQRGFPLLVGTIGLLTVSLLCSPPRNFVMDLSESGTAAYLFV